MQKIIPSILTISLLLTGYSIKPVMAEKPYQIAQSVWGKFTSKEYGFSILMPGKPIFLNQTINVKGKSIAFHIFSASQHNDRASYAVLVSDTLGEISEDKKSYIYESITAMLNKISDATLISQNDLNMNGYNGRSFEMQYTKYGVKFIAKGNIFIINNRLYEILADTSSDIATSLTGSTQGFLDSFELVNP